LVQLVQLIQPGRVFQPETFCRPFESD